MTRRARFLLLFLLGFTVLAPRAGAGAVATDGAPAAPAPATGIVWLGYEEGLARARETGRPLLISFWADWCKYCKKMKAETYVDPAVVAAVNRDFVAVTVNTTEDQKRAAEYFVRGLPTIWFVEKDGRTRITNLPGYVDAPTFRQILGYISSRDFEKMDFKTYTDQAK